jgi:hypothetical protein
MRRDSGERILKAVNAAWRTGHDGHYASCRRNGVRLRKSELSSAITHNSSSFQCSFLAGAIHENAPHRFRRRSEEMRAILKLRLLFGGDEPQPRLVNESGRLQVWPGASLAIL